MNPGWFQKTKAPCAFPRDSASARSGVSSASTSVGNNTLKCALPTGQSDLAPGTGRVISTPGNRPGRPDNRPGAARPRTHARRRQRRRPCPGGPRGARSATPRRGHRAKPRARAPSARPHHPRDRVQMKVGLERDVPGDVGHGPSSPRLLREDGRGEQGETSAPGGWSVSADASAGEGWAACAYLIAGGGRVWQTRSRVSSAQRLFPDRG